MRICNILVYVVTGSLAYSPHTHTHTHIRSSQVSGFIKKKDSGFTTESAVQSYMKKYTFPGYVSDFTPLNYIEPNGKWGRDKDRTSHKLETSGLDWSKFVHPSGWGLFLLTPYLPDDLEKLQKGEKGVINKVFVKNPPSDIGEKEVKIFSGSGNTRNQFQRFKKNGKFVTFSVKGGGIDCTRGHLSDYPGSFRDSKIKKNMQNPQ